MNLLRGCLGVATGAEHRCRRAATTRARAAAPAAVVCTPVSEESRPDMVWIWSAIWSASAAQQADWPRLGETGGGTLWAAGGILRASLVWRWWSLLDAMPHA